MTIDTREQLARDTKLELDGRQLLLKKLESAKQALETTTAKEKEKRETRAASLSEYRTEQDIQDAYGWGSITDGERVQLLEALAAGQQYVEETLTPAGVALSILNDTIRQLSSDVSSLKFELMTPEEQAERIKASEDLRERAEARRSARKEPKQ